MQASERRKEEIEKKKAKLAELRKVREERKLSLLDAHHLHSTLSKDRKEIESLVASLIGDFKRTRHEETNGQHGNGINNADENKETDQVEIKQRDPPILSVSEFLLIDFAPNEIVHYTKEIQTDEIYLTSELNIEKQNTQSISSTANSTNVDTIINTNLLHTESTIPTKEMQLTEDEKFVIIQSDSFSAFIDHSSKVIERALNETYDYTVDYRKIPDAKASSDSDSNLRQKMCFFSERWSRNRSITSVDWSKKYPELSLASYSQSCLPTSDPNGLVLLWNIHLPDRPEFVFHAESDVLVAKFSEFHPNLVIGGTYSGQIVIWDTRSNSQPVLKTPLTTYGHTHPIYDIKINGSQSTNALISSSTDGTICSWHLDMLAHPQEALQLFNSSQPKTDEVSVTCMSFPANESSTFMIGTEEGNIYQVNMNDRAGVKAGLFPFDCYKGHHCVITGVDFHTSRGILDFSDLFLSCGIDWSVRLWRAKSSTTPSVAPTVIHPLVTFETLDSVYDVKWSPVHPGIFGAIDGHGGFHIYNLNEDLEYPVASTKVNNGCALNKLSWDKEGRKVSIGSVDGCVYIYDAGDFSHATSEDWTGLKRTLTEIF